MTTEERAEFERLNAIAVSGRKQFKEAVQELYAMEGWEKLGYTTFRRFVVAKFFPQTARLDTDMRQVMMNLINSVVDEVENPTRR